MITKTSNKIPELLEINNKYGTTLKHNPIYILVGTYKSKELGIVSGILSATNNQFHAYVIRREIQKHGTCSIERTEYHPDGPTLSIAIYKEEITKLMESKCQSKK